MEQGWISLHRKMKDKGFYRKSEYVHLWIHLLLSANHEEKEFLWNGKIIKIQRGQFITGRNSLEKETGIDSSKIQRALELFENEHQIEQQKTNKYRLITILNWESYQKVNSKVNSKRTATEQQLNTNNNVITKNNENKDIVASDDFDFSKELEKLRNGKRKDYKIIALYWAKKGWKFENREQFNSALKRELKPASLLKGYSGEQIARAIKHCMDNYPEWTLETTFKRISDIVNK